MDNTPVSPHEVHPISDKEIIWAIYHAIGERLKRKGGVVETLGRVWVPDYCINGRQVLATIRVDSHNMYGDDL